MNSLPYKNIIFVGDSEVGKSSIFYQLKKHPGYKWSDIFISTIGVDFKTIEEDIDDQKIKLHIWDTAGNEKFKTITQSYYKGAHGFVFVYDITDEKSFQNIPKLIKEAKSVHDKQPVFILVGNKKDLEEKREVSYEKGKLLAEEFGGEFYEVSAKEFDGIEGILIPLVKEILRLEDNEENEVTEKGFILTKKSLERRPSFERKNIEEKED